MREKHKRDIVLKTVPVTNEKYWSSEVITGVSVRRKGAY